MAHEKIDQEYIRKIMSDEGREELTDAERIERLEAEVRRLSSEVRSLGDLEQRVAAMERKWVAKERSDASVRARFGRR